MKNWVVIGYLRKTKKKTLKKQEPSVRMLLVKTPGFFLKNIHWTSCWSVLEMPRGTEWGLRRAPLQHCRSSAFERGLSWCWCPTGTWAWVMSSLPQRVSTSPWPSKHPSPKIQTLTVQVCLPIQTYTDRFPIQHLYGRREVARSLYRNLFAAARRLGTSMHVSFACSITAIYAGTSSVTQLPGQMPSLWTDIGLASGCPWKYAS